MDWINIVNQVFDVFVVPVLIAVASALVSFIRKRTNQDQAESDSKISENYLKFLDDTITSCLRSTNQTFVNVLKEKGEFDDEAAEEALEITYQSVLNVLSIEAEQYISKFVGDLELYIKDKIEAKIQENKN